MTIYRLLLAWATLVLAIILSAFRRERHIHRESIRLQILADQQHRSRSVSRMAQPKSVVITTHGPIPMNGGYADIAMELGRRYRNGETLL